MQISYAPKFLIHLGHTLHNVSKMCLLFINYKIQTFTEENLGKVFL